MLNVQQHMVSHMVLLTKYCIKKITLKKYCLCNLKVALKKKKKANFIITFLTALTFPLIPLSCVMNKERGSGC